MEIGVPMLSLALLESYAGPTGPLLHGFVENGHHFSVPRYKGGMPLNTRCHLVNFHLQASFLLQLSLIEKDVYSYCHERGTKK